MIKLVAIDMDGTLLPENQHIPIRTVEILKKLSDKNVLLVAATGRPHKSVAIIEKENGIKFSAMILHNGAIVKEPKGNINYVKTFESELAGEVFDMCCANNIVCSAIYGDCYQVFVNKEDEFAEFVNTMYNGAISIYCKDYQEVKRLLNTYMEPNKFCITNKDPLKIDMAYEKLNANFKDKISILRAGPNFIDLAPQGLSKGIGLRVLMKQLGVLKEEVMAIGDSENDAEMLRIAGTSVAMKNGSLIIKNIARYETDSNEKEGVRKAIERFILND